LKKNIIPTCTQDISVITVGLQYGFRLGVSTWSIASSTSLR